MDVLTVHIAEVVAASLEVVASLGRKCSGGSVGGGRQAVVCEVTGRFCNEFRGRGKAFQGGCGTRPGAPSLHFNFFHQNIVGL